MIEYHHHTSSATACRWFLVISALHDWLGKFSSSKQVNEDVLPVKSIFCDIYAKIS